MCLQIAVYHEVRRYVRLRSRDGNGWFSEIFRFLIREAVVGVHDSSSWMENLPLYLPQYWLSGNRVPEIPGYSLLLIYIDDRFNRDIITATGPWSKLRRERPRTFRLEAAKAALHVALSVLIELDYTIGMKKSLLASTTSVEYLGLIVDSEKQSFLMLQRKRDSLSLFEGAHSIEQARRAIENAAAFFKASAHIFRWMCQEQNVLPEKSVRLELIVQGKIQCP